MIYGTLLGKKKLHNTTHTFSNALSFLQTLLNCPPAPENNDTHGNEVIRTLSEKQTDHGITIKREIKVHVVGPDPNDANKQQIEIREDMVKPGPDGKAAFTEHRRTISMVRK